MKPKSVVWRFFDRVEDRSGKTVEVLCKLCGRQYKFFGNTTNLKTHLVNKHPIQWELTQNGTLDESSIRFDEESNHSYLVTTNRHSRNKSKNHDDTDLEGQEEDNDATVTIVRQMQDGTEEWLEEPFQTAHIESHEPRRKKIKLRAVKREIETPPRRTSTYYSRPVQFDTLPEPPVPAQDEYSIFGEYIANKLRKFKTPRTQGNLQQLITTILWQAEYGMYDNADSVKRILMYSVNEIQSEHSLINHIHGEIVEQTDEPNQSNETEYP